MNLKSNKKLMQALCAILLMSSSFAIFATNYTNQTGKLIVITNVSAQKRNKKKHAQGGTQAASSVQIEIGEQATLDNNQGDEITITSPGISDKRKLFPTNNSFNYVVTMNTYGKKYEQFDINHAGQLEEQKKAVAKQEKAKKIKKEKAKKTKVKKAKAKSATQRVAS